MAKPRIHRHYRAHAIADWCARFLGIAPIVTWLKLGASTLATASLIFFGFVKFADFVGPDDFKDVPTLGWVYENRIAAAFALMIIQAIGQLGIFVLGFVRTRNTTKLRKALEAAIHQHFPIRFEDRHNYRATLFKVRRCPGIGRWLGVVARAGEKFHRTRTIFSIDPNEHSANTGLAGECFWQRGTLMMIVPKIEDDCDEHQKSEYIKATHMTTREFDAMNLKSCCFLLTCIKVDGKNWGVLSLDCDDPNALDSIIPKERTGNALNEGKPKARPGRNQRKRQSPNKAKQRLKQGFEHTALMINMLIE